MIVLGRFCGHIELDGADSAHDWTHVCALANGNVSAFREYLDSAGATT